MQTIKVMFLALLFLILAGCGTTAFQVAERDESGYFPAQGNVEVVKSVAVDLDQHKGLVVIGDSDFFDGQLQEIGFFEEILRIPELEVAIVQEGLSDKVQSVQDRIGLNNAAKHYKPFLWLRADSRRDGNRRYGQFILTDAISLEDLFIVETYYDTIWTGVSDQQNFYPMFNALIDYIDENSDTYQK